MSRHVVYMDKRDKRVMQKLAAKALRTYRRWRKMGYTPSQAKAIVHFDIMCLPGGRKNLFAENLLRRYRKESDGPTGEE